MNMLGDGCRKVEFFFQLCSSIRLVFLVNSRLCKCEQNLLAVSQKGLLVVKSFYGADVSVLEIKEAGIQIYVKDD